jgi:hypothetical protein
MAMDLSNKSGATLRVSGLHWAVFLTLAQAYGWKPAGTNRPQHLPPTEEWSGRYDSNDGQTVADSDAKLLAQALHGAAVSKEINIALADVIRLIERQIEAAGTRIPDPMRMKPEDFHQGFSPLLLFLYQGEFVID